MTCKNSLETVDYNGQTFTFERVDRIPELPAIYYYIVAASHEAALMLFAHMHGAAPLHRAKYYEQKSTGGRIYAFVKGEC